MVAPKAQVVGAFYGNLWLKYVKMPNGRLKPWTTKQVIRGRQTSLECISISPQGPQPAKALARRQSGTEVLLRSGLTNNCVATLSPQYLKPGARSGF